MKSWQVRWILVSALTVMLGGGAQSFAQQQRRDEPVRVEIQLGRGMSLITPGLMEVGAQTNLFLLIADRINLTEAQRKTLEEVLFEFQRYNVQREADYDVADAELKRLLTRDRVDMNAVRVKVKEIEAIRADVDIKKIESLLKAINTLTHDQHLRVVVLARELSAPPQPERRYQ